LLIFVRIPITINTRIKTRLKFFRFIFVKICHGIKKTDCHNFYIFLKPGSLSSVLCSILYAVFYKKGSYEPLLGDYLGMFTNDIETSEGSEIIEFVSAGP
jgi:hypothetical protein